MTNVTHMQCFKKQKLINRIDSLLRQLESFELLLTSTPIDLTEVYLNNPEPNSTNNIIPFKTLNK